MLKFKSGNRNGGKESDRDLDCSVDEEEKDIHKSATLPNIKISEVPKEEAVENAVENKSATMDKKKKKKEKSKKKKKNGKVGSNSIIEDENSEDLSRSDTNGVTNGKLPKNDSCNSLDSGAVESPEVYRRDEKKKTERSRRRTNLIPDFSKVLLLF